MMTEFRFLGELYLSSVLICRLKKILLVSGSQDCTVKVWDVPETLSDAGCEPAVMTACHTEKAHDKVSLTFT